VSALARARPRQPRPGRQSITPFPRRRSGPRRCDKRSAKTVAAVASSKGRRSAASAACFLLRGHPAALRPQRAMRHEDRLAAGGLVADGAPYVESGLVFTNEPGGMLDLDPVSKAFSVAATKVGVKAKRLPVACAVALWRRAGARVTATSSPAPSRALERRSPKPRRVHYRSQPGSRCMNRLTRNAI
jgi:hypothetical protein